jgi:hypothetical protein
MCTLVDTEGELSIAPGRQATVRFSIFPPPEGGVSSQEVELRFSDGSVLVVPIEARFPRCISSNPSDWETSFAPFALEETPVCHLEMSLCFVGEVSPDQFMVTCDDERVAVVRSEKRKEAGCPLRIGFDISIDPQGEIGPINIPLRIDLLGKSVRGVSLRGGFSSGVVALDRAPLFFGSCGVGTSTSELLQFSLSDGWAVESLSLDGPFESIARYPPNIADGGGQYSVEITMTPTSRGAVSGFLEMDLRHREGEQRRYRVRLIGSAY